MACGTIKIDAFSPANQPVARRLRELIMHHGDGIKETVKWGKPTFVVGDQNIFYLDDAKDHVKLGLFNGAPLAPTTDLIEGTGKKMRHIKVRPNFSEPPITDIIDAALATPT